MATEQDIEVIEDNDPAVVFTCKLDGVVVDLTGAVIEMIIKDQKSTQEDAAGVIRYSTATGDVAILTQSGVTLGQCRVQMKASDLATPVKKRYRLDVTTAGKKLTYAFGRVIVVDV